MNLNLSLLSPLGWAALLTAFCAACSGQTSPVIDPSAPTLAHATAPCVPLAPPEPGTLADGWEAGDPVGEMESWPLPDLDSDKRPDVFVTATELRSASGDAAGIVFLERDACWVSAGLVWAEQLTAGEATHNGLSDLVAFSSMTSEEFETRYCFDGQQYQPFAQRRRGYYTEPSGAEPGRLRLKLEDTHWEAWGGLAETACRAAVDIDLATLPGGTCTLEDQTVGEPTDGLALLAIESMEVDGTARMVFLLGSDDLEAAPAVPRATARTLEPGTLELTIHGIRQNTSGTLPSFDEEGLRVGDATVVELGTLHSFDAANIDDDQAVRFLLYTSDASARFSLSTSTAPYAIVLDVRGEH